MMAIDHKPRPELTNLLIQTLARYARMTSEEKAAMHAAQRKSWVVGEMLLAHPEMSRKHVEKIYADIMEEG
jgi:hypothetical protein